MDPLPTIGRPEGVGTAGGLILKYVERHDVLFSR